MIIVMVLTAIISLLAIAASQIGLQAERGSRFERDYQIAFQAAEAALMDAQFDIRGPNNSINSRTATFVNTDIVDFLPDCVGTGPRLGLCAENLTGKPAWLTVDFLDISNNAKTVPFGTFTGRTFVSGSTGLQPARPPRYVIEPILERSGCRTASCGKKRYVYRVTAIGFGPNINTKVVLQMIFKKENA